MSNEQTITMNIAVNGGNVHVAFSQITQALQQSLTQINQQFTSIQQSIQAAFKQTSEDAAQSMANQTQAVSLYAASIQPVLQALEWMGTCIKEAVNETIEWTRETNSLAQTLGITAIEAGGLTKALCSLDISTDTYKGAVFNLQRSLDNQEDAFERNGIAVKNANGEMLSVQEVMMNTLCRLKEMKPGYDANALSMMAFGRSAKDVQELQKITNDEIAKGIDRVKALGIEVDYAGTNAVQRYKEAMNDVKDALQALRINIAQDLLPTIANLTRSFADLAFRITEPLSKAVGWLINLFSHLGVVIGAAAIALRTQIAAAMTYLSTVVFPALIARLKLLIVNFAAVIFLKGGFVMAMQSMAQSVLALATSFMGITIAVAGALYALQRMESANARAIADSREATNALIEQSAAIKGEFDELSKLESKVKNNADAKRRYAEIVENIIAQAPHLEKFLKKDGELIYDSKEAKEAYIKAQKKEIDNRMLNIETLHMEAQMYLREQEELARGADSVFFGLIGKNNVFRQSWVAMTGSLQNARSAFRDVDEDLKKLIASRAALDAPPAENKSAFKNKGKDNNIPMDKWSRELQHMEAAEGAKAAKQGQYYEKSLEKERAFWQGKLKQCAKNSDDYLAIQDKILSATMSINQKSFDGQIASLKAEEQALAGNLEAQLAKRLEIAEKYKNVTSKYIEAMEGVAAKQKEIKERDARIGEAYYDQVKKLEAMELQSKSNKLAHEVAMGRMTNETRLHIERDLIIAQHQIDKDDLESEMKRAEDKIELWNTLFLRLEMMEQEHKNRLAAIDQQADEEAKQRADAAAAELKARLDEQAAPWRQLSDSIKASMENCFIGLANGTMSWSNATKNMLNTVLQHFIQMAAKEFASFLSYENLKTLFKKKAVAEQTAAKIAGGATEQAIDIQTATTGVTASSVEAGAGVFASIAKIPIVGPFLAPAAAAAAIAAVMALLGKLSSAAGGWGQVPYDQLAMVHKDEMVLPSKYASPMRSMLEQGGEFGGGSNSQPIIINISAVDSQDVKRLFKNHGPAMVEAIKAQTRNFAFQG